MPAWKVFVIIALAVTCLGLAFATIIVPMNQITSASRWMWLGGLLAATVCMGTVFTMFLRNADRNFKM